MHAHTLPHICRSVLFLWQVDSFVETLRRVRQRDPDGFREALLGGGADQDLLERVMQLSFMQQNRQPVTQTSAVEALPSIIVDQPWLDEAKDNTSCAICQEDVRLGDEVTKLPCPGAQHMFHRGRLESAERECVGVVKYLQEYGNKCPVCRHELPSDEAAPTELPLPTLPLPGGPLPFPPFLGGAFGAGGADEGQWTCSGCDANNPMRRSTCSACGTNRNVNTAFEHHAETFERAAALIWRLRTSGVRSEAVVEGLSAEFETLCRSRLVESLEAGGWIVREALRFIWQNELMMREYTHETAGAHAESDINSRGMLRRFCRLINNSNPEELIQRVSTFDRVGLEPSQASSPGAERVAELAGPRAPDLCEDVARAVAQGATDEVWDEIVARLLEFQERGWRVFEAAMMMRLAGVRDFSILAADVDPRSGQIVRLASTFPSPLPTLAALPTSRPPDHPTYTPSRVDIACVGSCIAELSRWKPSWQPLRQPCVTVWDPARRTLHRIPPRVACPLRSLWTPCQGQGALVRSRGIFCTRYCCQKPGTDTLPRSHGSWRSVRMLLFTGARRLTAACQSNRWAMRTSRQRSRSSRLLAFLPSPMPQLSAWFRWRRTSCGVSVTCCGRSSRCVAARSNLRRLVPRLVPLRPGHVSNLVPPQAHCERTVLSCHSS